MQAENEKKDERNLQLIADYQAGVATAVICGRYQVSNTRMYQILDDYKIPRRGTHYKPERNKQIAKALKKGVSVPEIAREHGISTVRVYEIRDQMGLKPKG